MLGPEGMLWLTCGCLLCAQIFTFVIGQCFLTMLCSMHYGVFLFFAGVVLIMTLWVVFFLPETKGRDLESTFRAFQEHWFWKSNSRVRFHCQSKASTATGMAHWLRRLLRRACTGAVLSTPRALCEMAPHRQPCC